MKKIVICFFLTCSVLASQGQELSIADSLLKRLNAEKSDTGRITLYYKISHELQFNNRPQALMWAEKALEESDRIGYRKGKANALVQLGNIEQVSGNYDKAWEYNNEALKIFEKYGPEEGLAICYNNFGIIAHSRNEYTLAAEYYRKSLSINRKISRLSGEATSLFCLGTVNENTAQYDSALIYYLQAEKISESINDTKLIAYARISLANVYYSMGDLKNSASYNLNAADLYLREGNHLGLVKVYSSLGLIFSQLGNHKEATDFYRRALEASLSLSSKSDISNSYYYLAQEYEQRDMKDSAYLFYRYACNTYRELKDYENATYALISMARLEDQSGRPETAVSLLNEALKKAEEIKNPLPAQEVYRELAIASAKSGDYRKAWSYQNMYTVLSDSIMNTEKQKQILDLQTKYETDKKEKENALLKKDQKILLMTRTFLITGAALLGLIILIVLRSLSVKKKDNRLLRQQKEEIARQRDTVERQKGEITDSIKYARRIQSAMLPPTEQISAGLPESFILYLPRDIVSGDFYLVQQLDDDKILFCVADCTGHGVPGAMMSMLGISLMNDIINRNLESIIHNSVTPARILELLRKRIKESLRQTGRDNETKDGMDMSLCIFEHSKRALLYAGANNPAYYVAGGILTEIKATRNPVGIHLAETEYIDNSIILPYNSIIYLFSDGYADQIGPGGKKFLSKNFKKLLENIASFSPEEQREKLLQAHLMFRDREEQIDDILVLGVKI